MFQGQADFFTDFARNQLVVTGEHFDCDAVLLKSGYSRRRGFLRRIEECYVAFQDKVVFVVFVIRGLGIPIAIGEG